VAKVAVSYRVTKPSLVLHSLEMGEIYPTRHECQGTARVHRRSNSGWKNLNLPLREARKRAKRGQKQTKAVTSVYLTSSAQVSATSSIGNALTDLEHNITIADPSLPVVNVGTVANPSYLPLQVCNVQQGQVARGQISPKQTAEMIKFAVRSPSAMLIVMTVCVRLNSPATFAHCTRTSTAFS